MWRRVAARMLRVERCGERHRVLVLALREDGELRWGDLVTSSTVAAMTDLLRWGWAAKSNRNGRTVVRLTWLGGLSAACLG